MSHTHIEVFSRRENAVIKVPRIVVAPPRVELEGKVGLTPEEKARVEFHNDAIDKHNVLARYHGASYQYAQQIDATHKILPTLALDDAEWRGVYTGALQTVSGYLGFKPNPPGAIYAVYQPQDVRLEVVPNMDPIQNPAADKLAKELLATHRSYALEGPQSRDEKTLIERVIHITGPVAGGDPVPITVYTKSLFKVVLSGDGILYTGQDDALEDDLMKNYSNRRYPLA